MRPPRTSIAGLMGIVLVASLAFTALRSGSRIWAGTTFLATCGVLALAVVGAVCRDGKDRAWWLGFALFGGGYLALIFGRVESLRRWNSPLDLLLDRVGPWAGGLDPGYLSCFGPTVTTRAQVVHCLFALAAGVVGGLIALVVFGAPPGRSGDLPAGTRPGDPPARVRWRHTVVSLSGFVAALGLVAVGLHQAAGPTAALVYYATWGLLLLAIPAAFFGPRSRRAAWLGAALFGIGYMNMVSQTPRQPNWPYAVTDGLLRALRDRMPWIIPEIPPTSGDTAAANARILRALDRPIPMHYPKETPLEVVLKDIQAATHVPGSPDLPIYVDPLALQEVEKTMQSPVTIDLEGPPLRSALHVMLTQLGLSYGVGGRVAGHHLLRNRQHAFDRLGGIRLVRRGSLPRRRPLRVRLDRRRARGPAGAGRLPNTTRASGVEGSRRLDLTRSPGRSRIQASSHAVRGPIMASALRLQRRLWFAVAAIAAMLPGVASASDQKRCEAMPAGCTACACCHEAGPAAESTATPAVVPAVAPHETAVEATPCACRSDEPTPPARLSERGDEGRRINAGRSLAADEPPIPRASRPFAVIAFAPDVGPPRSPIYLRTSRLLI